MGRGRVVVMTLVLLAGCSGSSDDHSLASTTSIGAPSTTVPVSTTTFEATTTVSSTTVAARRLVWAMAFDKTAVFGRLIRSSADPTEVLARYDTAQRKVTASVEVAPIVDMRRAGEWLWVLQMSSKLEARSPDFFPLGNAAELSWLDPATLERRGRMTLDSTGVIAIVHDSLWVGTTTGIVRVALADGHLLDATPITVGGEANVASIAETIAGQRIYAVAERFQQFSVVQFDAVTGTIVAQGPVVGAGPGGVHIDAGDAGIWLSYATGMSGTSVRIDPATLTGVVAINDNARPKARQGSDVLWVDGSWGGFVGCANATTGELIWRENFANSVPVTFATGIDGRSDAYAAWSRVEPPANCKL